MSIISKMRKQKCVYWAPAGTSKDGRRTFAAPVQLDCRWEETAELFIKADGTEATSRAVAYVSADVVQDGCLLLGTLVTGMTNVPSAYGALPIRSFAKTPNLKATEYLRKAIM